MLPADHRMRRSPEFAVTVRRGRRVGGRRVVVHLLLPGVEDGTGPAEAGFVVSRAVGGAVVRTRVKRRLRHLVADRVSAVPAGARLVVRANPAAASATSAQLGADLDRQIAAALAGREERGRRPAGPGGVDGRPVTDPPGAPGAVAP